MPHIQYTSGYAHITPEQWQKLLLQGQVDAIVDQINLFPYVHSQSGELCYEGPETVTVVLKIH